MQNLEAVVTQASELVIGASIEFADAFRRRNVREQQSVSANGFIGLIALAIEMRNIKEALSRGPGGMPAHKDAIF